MKNLKKYLENLLKEDYSITNEEDVKEFIDTVMRYADENNLTSLNEVHIYIDGLLTNFEFQSVSLG